MKNKALKLTLATALGIFVGVTLFDALPRKKTVDDYVNCFRNAEVKAMPFKESESLTNVWVHFYKSKINKEEAKEFFEKINYRSKSNLDNGGSYLTFELDIQQIQDPGELADKLFDCFKGVIGGVQYDKREKIESSSELSDK
ncbi:hypothetical protein HYX19_01060 [Candidatus Woesearchaeota archaeon]|nr:hypothetical protein [Candidatus Woesearchaeota archaeon]